MADEVRSSQSAVSVAVEATSPAIKSAQSAVSVAVEATSPAIKATQSGVSVAMMAPPTRATGSDVFLKFNGTQLDTNYKTLSVSESVTIHDQSPGSAIDRTFLTAELWGSASATIKRPAGDTAVWDALVPGASGTLEWGDQPTAPLKTRFYADAIVSKRRKTALYDGSMIIDALWTLDGAIGETVTTILGMRGWECGNSMVNAADASNTARVGVSSTHHTGAYSLKIGATAGSWARFAIAGTPTDPSVSVWVHSTNEGWIYDANDYLRLRYELNTGEFIDLRWNGATHTFDAYVDGGLVAAGTVEVSAFDWFNVQFYVVSANAGSIGVKIDGHQSITYAGDTMPGIAGDINYIYVYGGNTAGAASSYCLFDDLVLGSGGYVGSQAVYDKLVASDDTTAWSPFTGADNYAMEDEVPPSDADYNETGTTGHVDKLGLAALSVTGFTVTGVEPWSRAADPDAHGSSIKVGIDSNGTESTATTALAAAYEYYWGGVDMTNPADSAAWEQADLDALLHMKESVIP